MAVVYVYRHRSGGNNSRGVGLLGKRLVNGQLIYFTGEWWQDPGVYLHLFYYYDYDKLRWETNFVLTNSMSYPANGTIVNDAGDRIYPLPYFNRTVYGSRYAYGSGSHYGLRTNTMLQKPNSSGDGWVTHYRLDHRHRVIINGGQGYTFSNKVSTANFNRIRCWGFIRPDGSVVETSGLYVHVNYITNPPGSYALHTR